MLKFWLCFLSFFYTVNSFSTEEKQEEQIKCYSCDEIVMTITKNKKEENDEEEYTVNKKEENDEPNYTVEKPFASLSCIFDC